MVKFMLNLHKFNNYAFFCPVTRLHLTVSSPVGFANEVTPAILTALKAETILDVDGVVDIETGTVKEAAGKTPAKAPEQKSADTKKNDDGNSNKEADKAPEEVAPATPEAEVPEQNSNEEIAPETEAPAEEEKPTAKKGKKAAAKAE